MASLTHMAVISIQLVPDLTCVGCFAQSSQMGTRADDCRELRQSGGCKLIILERVINRIVDSQEEGGAINVTREVYPYNVPGYAP